MTTYLFIYLFHNFLYFLKLILINNFLFLMKFIDELEVNLKRK
jgi:hypothetical protein